MTSNLCHKIRIHVGAFDDPQHAIFRIFLCANEKTNEQKN